MQPPFFSPVTIAQVSHQKIVLLWSQNKINF